MKTLKKDVISEAVEVGKKTSKVAEALQTNLTKMYSDILLGNVKASSIDEAYKQMSANTQALFGEALRGFQEIEKEVGKNAELLLGRSKRTAKRIARVDSDDRIKDYLKRITRNQINENRKITYKNGRQIGFKEYVEMATRTRIQHELLDRQKELGEMTKQIFYICDTYSDCANDHLEYQGKMYYDAKVFSQIPQDNPFYEELLKGVRKCKASVEEVTQNKPYLLTRPNCRHRLIPISIDDAIGLSERAVLRKNKADRGNYSQSEIKKNYDATQKQRRIEHNIRQSKVALDINEQAYNKTHDAHYLKEINRNKYHIRMQQRNMRVLMRENPSLKRDYRRENPYHLQKDLGVKYNEQPIKAEIKVSEAEMDRLKIDFKHEEFLEELEIVKKMDDFMETLDDETAEILYNYQSEDYRNINRFMYDRDSLDQVIKGSELEKHIIQDIDRMHQMFLNYRELDVKGDKALVLHRGGLDLIKENDTTIILNGFTSTSVRPSVAEKFTQWVSSDDGEKALYEIIVPPDAQNQIIYNKYARLKHEAEFIVDTNSVYDIIGEEYKRIHTGEDIKKYTMILRPKHKGVKR